MNPQNAKLGVILSPNNMALNIIDHNAAVELSAVPMAAPIKSTALYQQRYVVAPSMAIPRYATIVPLETTFAATTYQPISGKTIIAYDNMYIKYLNSKNC